jgi:hypothetical protein
VLGHNNLPLTGAIIITAHFTMPQAIDIEVTGSSIGPLDVKLLSEEMNEVAKSIALPWINYKGQHEVSQAMLVLVIFRFLFDTFCFALILYMRTGTLFSFSFTSAVSDAANGQGFAIPVPPGLQLSNSSVSVGASYVSISSDVHLQ